MTAIYTWAQKHGVSTAALHELAFLSVLPTVQTMNGGLAKSEARISSEIRLGSANIGAMLFRNNNGVAFNPDGRPVRFGLGNDSAKLNDVFKSSDLIGFNSVGRFVAVEVKASGWRFKENDDHEQAQRNFLDTVVKHGGIGLFATSWQQVHDALIA